MRVLRGCLMVLMLMGGYLGGGCARHTYDVPARAFSGSEEYGDQDQPRQEQPDYYVLVWSTLNVAGRRQPSCPYEVVAKVEARASSLSASDSWDEDKKLASRRTINPDEPLRDDDPESLPLLERQDLSFPDRLESKLLEQMREKARSLAGDAIIDLVIHRSQKAGGLGITVQNVDMARRGDIEKITGAVIRFTDPDCRH